MSLFVRHYNQYMKTNDRKNSDNNLIKFKKSNPTNKLEDKKK